MLALPPQIRAAGIGGNRAVFIVYLEDGLAIALLPNLVRGNPERFIPQIAGFYQAPPTKWPQ